MLEVICFVIFVILLFAMCITVVAEGKTSSKTSGMYLIALFATLAVFSFFFEPKEFIRWDLIEHFYLLDEMREGGIKYVVFESHYKDLYVFNFFAYFISTLPENLKNLLTTIPLVIDFAIVGYIYRKMFKTYLPETDGKVRILAVVMWLCTFGVKLAISGIRCSFAVSLVALAIYLLLTKEKRKVLSIIISVLLCVVAAFVHNFALVVILTWLASKLRKPVLTMLIALGIGFAIEPISRFMINNVNSGYLRFSFSRILQTMEDRSFISAIKNFDHDHLHDPGHGPPLHPLLPDHRHHRGPRFGGAGPARDRGPHVLLLLRHVRQPDPAGCPRLLRGGRPVGGQSHEDRLAVGAIGPGRLHRAVHVRL